MDLSDLDKGRAYRQIRLDWLCWTKNWYFLNTCIRLITGTSGIIVDCLPSNCFSSFVTALIYRPVPGEVLARGCVRGPVQGLCPNTRMASSQAVRDSGIMLVSADRNAHPTLNQSAVCFKTQPQNTNRKGLCPGNPHFTAHSFTASSCPGGDISVEVGPEWMEGERPWI